VIRGRIMLTRLHLQSQPVRNDYGMRLGWLFVSLSLLAMAGYFLYPVLESFTEPREAPPLPPRPITETVVVEPAEPVGQPAKQSKSRAQAVDRASIPAKPIRETAPQAPEGIRNRIEGVIPVEVTLRIGRDGSVESAHAQPQHDAVRSYLARQAVAAARQWRFRPARVGQTTVSSQWTVRFRFYRSGVEWN
jgi:TonB family protein